MFTDREDTLLRFRGDDREVKIPARIRHIGEKAFCGNRTLERIRLPATLRSIGESAFAGCTALREVVLSPRLQDIGARAFQGCSVLEHLDLPPSLRTLQPYSLAETGLTSITIPGKTVEVPHHLLADCPSLQSVVVEEGVKKIGEGAFANCVSLRQVTLPPNLRKIEKDVFRDCKALESIEIPEGVKVILPEIFCGCSSLRSIRFPATAAGISPRCALACFALQQVEVAPENPAYRSEDGKLMTGDGRTLILCPVGDRGVCRIPEGVQRADPSAFCAAVEAKELHLPESMRDITSIPSFFLHSVSVIYAKCPLFVFTACPPGTFLPKVAVIADHLPIHQAPSWLQRLLLNGFILREKKRVKIPTREVFLRYISQHTLELWKEKRCRKVILKEGMIAAEDYTAFYKCLKPKREKRMVAAMQEYRTKHFPNGEVEAADAIEAARIASSQPAPQKSSSARKSR